MAEPQRNFSEVLGVMSVFMIWQFLIIVNPALATLQSTYPDVAHSTILLVSTLPSLMIVPTSIFSGFIVGKKIKYKTLCVISIVLLLISGLTPYFISGFYILLFSRIIFGIGQGLSQPLGNALVMKLFDKKKAPKLIGIGGTVKNITGVILQIIAGIVCVIDLNYVWLIHLLLIIPLLLILFFLPEPEKDEVIGDSKTTQKAKVPAMVYKVSLAFGLLFTIYYPLLLNMSSIVTTEGIGNAANTGTILSMYTVGGMAAGLVFGWSYKLTGKFIIPLSLIIHLAGMAMGYFGHSMAPLMGASLLTGISVYFLTFAIMTKFQAALPSASLAPASAFFVAVLQLSAFLASPYTGIVSSFTGSSDPRTPIIVGIVLSVIISVVWTIIELTRGDTKPQTPLQSNEA